MKRGNDVVIVRPTSVYGPGDIRGWLKLFRMATRGWFLMVGSGRTMNHPVYVENLTDLFELTAHSPAARGRTYIAGGTTGRSRLRSWCVRSAGQWAGT